MQKNSPTPPVRYLPFNEFHIAEIRDLSPDSIKRAGKEVHLDSQTKPTLNQRYDYIAKQLGYKHMASCQHEYVNYLRPFMDKNDLLTRTDLCTPRLRGPNFVSLTARRISDRLFRSGKPLPSRIFTGYNYDWQNVNRHRRANNSNLSKFDEVYNQWVTSQSTLVLESAVYRLIDNGWDNLIGGQLFEYPSPSDFTDIPVARIYFPKNIEVESRCRTLAQQTEEAKILRLFLENINDGWIDVIRYNDFLVFLKGVNGEFDFVFPRLRG